MRGACHAFFLGINVFDGIVVTKSLIYLIASVMTRVSSVIVVSVVRFVTRIYPTTLQERETQSDHDQTCFVLLKSRLKRISANADPALTATLPYVFGSVRLEVLQARQRYCIRQWTTNIFARSDAAADESLKEGRVSIMVISTRIEAEVVPHGPPHPVAQSAFPKGLPLLAQREKLQPTHSSPDRKESDSCLSFERM